MLLVAVATIEGALAQPAPTPIEELLLENTELIQESSRRTIEPAIAAIADSGLEGADVVLQRWEARDLFVRESDGRFFLAERGDDRDTYNLFHVVTKEPMGTAGRREVDQIKPNSGIRALIAAALVKFQLTNPDPAVRRGALEALLREPSAEQLDPLRAALGRENDPFLKGAMERAERLLTVRFEEDEAKRVEAIESFAGDLSVEARATLNPLLNTTLKVSKEGPDEDENVARVLTPGSENLSFDAAYDLLVRRDLAPRIINAAARDAALVEHIENGMVAGVPVASLDTREARDAAYSRLEEQGAVTQTQTEDEIADLIASFTFYEVYSEPEAITGAVLGTIAAINRSVAGYGFLDIALDALSLASIYFLAAIGLAITFGVMGVINMAHGEFIMMGAYTGYVVQQFIPNYTASLVVALPLAFLVTFAAGVLLERLVIRWLYHRPLETLLATFGVSIALQQLAKNIFGTQARPLTAPDWLGGALVINDVVAISYIRIAIFVLAIIFLVLLLFILNHTRLGLEVRSVRQNPRMASSMGINPDRINMLTFGLGSGIAGIAGVAIGLFAKVTSDLGSGYIVQSFMTVVVGGVGNIWGTLAGATLIGFLQKGIEWFNPSNTLAAQTYMIIFIIIFIQFRPKGIFALKGRAAEA
ncbi:urea ABC transporter permease subunit UrtB [Acuticoccus sp. 2012]|uniref:Urea ABC transporter permease subunit UrtB n=2 Tax=Acuticoccus mangrovi TaxID=2796142 RepID=A0A934ML52_9HYPH|nr:urea ABC transporter permease subunit UrtB [Acuticoccus mangrovi]MBJ3776039.1 urea ABC transporter permease subunit UrtB [Acuticoccus mangrovi]